MGKLHIFAKKNCANINQYLSKLAFFRKFLEKNGKEKILKERKVKKEKKKKYFGLG